MSCCSLAQNPPLRYGPLTHHHHLLLLKLSAHDGTIAGMKDPSLFKYVSRLCPSRANFSGDTPIPHFDSKDAPMSFSAGFSSGDYEWLEVRQYEMGVSPRSVFSLSDEWIYDADIR